MNPVIIPETGISSHSHLLNILRNQDFSIAFYQLKRTPHQIRRIFSISKNVTGSFCLILTFHKN